MSRDPQDGERVVVSANALRSGAVVYRRTDGDWTSDLDTAAAAETPAAADALLRAAGEDAGRGLVVDPILVAVDRIGDETRPRRLRDRIRAEGPSAGSSRPVTAPR